MSENGDSMGPRRKKRRTKCTQTPPSNMAAPSHFVNNPVSTSPELSQVIATANESIYGVNSSIMNFNPSENQHSTPMNNPNFQIFHPQIPQMSLPVITAPSMVMPQPATPPAVITNTVSVPNNTPSAIQVDPVQFQMLINTVNQMSLKLTKLDRLDEICTRINVMEKHFCKLDSEIIDIKNDLKEQSKRINDEEFHYSIVEDRVSKMENENEGLKYENNQLKEELLNFRAYSMKYNLIFGGIPESENRENENCETVLKKFISKELGIVDDIEFQNVHRLRHRNDDKPRNIIGKFVKYSDHEKVLEKAKATFSDRECPFSVFQQYPIEISNRRKELLPKMHTLRRQGYKNARVVMDKLYIGNEMINPADVPTYDPQAQPQQGPSFRPDIRPNFAPQFRPPLTQQPPLQFRPQGPGFAPPQTVRPDRPRQDPRTESR